MALIFWLNSFVFMVYAFQYVLFPCQKPTLTAPKQVGFSELLCIRKHVTSEKEGIFLDFVFQQPMPTVP